jgi:hypothetical protein
MIEEKDGFIPSGTVTDEDGIERPWLFGDEDTFFELLVDDEGNLFFSGWTFYIYFNEGTDANETKFEFLPEVKNFPFMDTKQPLQLIK